MPLPHGHGSFLPTVIAPFDFGILKTEQKLEKDLDEAKKSVPYSFTRDQDFVNNQISQIDTFFIYLNDINTAHDQYLTSQDSLYNYRYEPEFESFQNSFIAERRIKLERGFSAVVASCVYFCTGKTNQAEGELHFGRVHRPDHLEPTN